MTENEYVPKMLLVLERFQDGIKELQELTDKFKKENPDARYDRVVGWNTELDKRLEELSFIQPYVEDILNGLAINHTYRHKESGYDRSRTKKVRKAYSYNI